MKTTSEVTKAEFEEPRQLLNILRSKIEAKAQPDKGGAALKRMEELEQAVLEMRSLESSAGGLEALPLELAGKTIMDH